jgi:quercetin dioxygenase-like cupin family protein
MKTEPTIVNLADVEPEPGGGMARQVMLSPSISGTSCLRVVRVSGENGQGRPAHTHPGDETLFVMQGNAALTVNGVEYQLKAEDAAVIPARVEHSLSITGDAPFIAVTVFCDECEARQRASF